VNFTVQDAEQHPLALTVAVHSSDASLIPADRLTLGGSGGTRTLTVTPAGGKTGVATVTVTVGDGLATVDRTFRVTATNMPPLIVSEPQSRTANLGANTTFSVTADGTAPLRYQWFKGTDPIAGGTGASLTLRDVQPAHAGSYHVVVENISGGATSTHAGLEVNTNIATGLYWIGGSEGGSMSNLKNYAVKEDGSGGAPDAINPGDVIEYTAHGTVSRQISQAVDLSFGAFHNNTNTAGTDYIFFNGNPGQGTWTLHGALVQGVETITNAAFVNDQERGFNFKPNLVLDGGGEFAFVHRSGSSGEFQGESLKAINGDASLIFQGQTPAGSHVRFMWGKNDGSTTWDFKGSVTVREQAIVEFKSGFDIAAEGGVLDIDPESTGAEFKMDGDITFKVAALRVKGKSLTAGTYDREALKAAGCGDAFTGNGGTIIVTGEAIDDTRAAMNSR